MKINESPNTAFTILYTRFKKGTEFRKCMPFICTYHFYLQIHTSYTAPDIVIYDNACNLHSYCLNREPKFFEKTWFLVDRFHWPNHTGDYLFNYAYSHRV